MRRLVVLACIGGLLLSVAPGLAEAGPKRKKRVERMEEVSYSCPCGTRVGADTKGVMLFGFGGVTWETKAIERYITIEISDSLGGPVSAIIAQDTNPGNSVYEGRQDVCGETEEPVKITPGTPIDIYFYVGTCADAQTLSHPTTGTVTVTFSNLP